jgi:hypothetical protein
MLRGLEAESPPLTEVRGSDGLKRWLNDKGQIERAEIGGDRTAEFNYDPDGHVDSIYFESHEKPEGEAGTEDGVNWTVLRKDGTKAQWKGTFDPKTLRFTPEPGYASEPLLEPVAQNPSS